MKFIRFAKNNQIKFRNNRINIIIQADGKTWTKIQNNGSVTSTRRTTKISSRMRDRLQVRRTIYRQFRTRYIGDSGKS